MGVNEFGIIIDEILDTEEIVVKPLNKTLKKINLFSGAYDNVIFITIMLAFVA